MSTIHDVARLAGVSIKTVSRVINHETPIRPETVARVNEAIAKLGYEPHRGARMMRSGKSGLIGLVTGLFSDTRTAKTRAGLSDLSILRGAQIASRAAGKILLAADAGGPSSDPDTLSNLLKTFAAHRVEGLIYAAPHHQQVLLPPLKGTPLLLVNCFDLAGTPAVVPDDSLGQAQVVDHLVSRGHRRIGYVGVDENMVAGRLRKAAFVEACARHGLDPAHCPALIGSALHDPSDPFTPLRPALQEIARHHPRPSALCLGNDIMALQAIRELQALGLRVPEDIALMGFDNDEVICEAASPSLSTVVLPYFEMGQIAVQRLLDLIAGRQLPRSGWERVAGEVVSRDSVPWLAAPAFEPD